MSVKPIPEAYTAITPFLVVPDAAHLIEFVQEVFDGRVDVKMEMPGTGMIMHAELSIAGAKLMACSANERYRAMPALLYVYVPDTDRTIAKAIAAGATLVAAAADQFYGDRTGMVKDRNNISWSIATHTEDVSPEELRRRSAAMHQK